jgi:Tfp pilus assembly protein PilZ
MNESSTTTRLFELITRMSEDEQQTLLKELEARLSKGRRKHKREPFFMVADYSTEDHVYRDYIQNVSAGGVFIETHMPFTSGQEVSLAFPLPNYQKYIKIIGKVARVTPQGIGLVFKMVNQEQETMVKSLLEWLTSTKR